MAARTLMVQGTASSVGKSLMVTALCRIFRRRGLRVAPFKAQNMALNSFVTLDGSEIGRAQAVQAEAAGIAPAVEMNPILLKPEAGMRSQVVVMGRPVGSMTLAAYHERKAKLKRVIADCLRRLEREFDLVVIEGAGSPAEINLNSYDIVNMHVAEAANAPVVLVGDIDRGGVFAHLVGTMELIAPAHRRRVAAFLINKFRGDAALLKPGFDFLTARFAIPVLGVVPYIPRLRIADEDSVALDDRSGRRVSPTTDIDIAIVRLPRISNYDDFLALEHEPGTVVRFIEEPDAIADADLLVIPGSKSTVDDLAWLRRCGLAEATVARARRREPIIGICGGCQMLGEAIEDPDGVESPVRFAAGMGLLALRTRFGREKLTAQVKAQVACPTLLSGAIALKGEFSAYEIHMGRMERSGLSPAPFRIVARGGIATDTEDGAISADGAVAGTMLHGLFENDTLRQSLMRYLRERKGVAAASDADAIAVPGRETEYDRLATIVEENINLPILEKITGLRR